MKSVLTWSFLADAHLRLDRVEIREDVCALHSATQETPN